ncbi:MAG: hypothetical protein AAB223_11195 [Pseudomonadota bacterium]
MKRPIFSIWAAAGLALIAAACAEVPSAIYAPAPAPDAPAPDRAARPPARPETPPADASALVGRDARAVAELLGEPQLKRRDPPAELWQYRAGPCVLDLFLYADKAGSAATVTHVEMRAVPPPGAHAPKNIDPAASAPGFSLGRHAPPGGPTTKSPDAIRAECLRAVRDASGGVGR